MPECFVSLLVEREVENKAAAVRCTQRLAQAPTCQPSPTCVCRSRPGCDLQVWTCMVGPRTYFNALPPKGLSVRVLREQVYSRRVDCLEDKVFGGPRGLWSPSPVMCSVSGSSSSALQAAQQRVASGALSSRGLELATAPAPLRVLHPLPGAKLPLPPLPFHAKRSGWRRTWRGATPALRRSRSLHVRRSARGSCRPASLPGAGSTAQEVQAMPLRFCAIALRCLCQLAHHLQHLCKLSGGLAGVSLMES